MADLTATLGVDIKEFEKGLADAGKSIGKMGGKAENPFSESAKQFSSLQGIGGMVAGPIGSTIGAFFDAFGGMISSALSKVKEIADYSKQIRLASISTGLSIDSIRRVEAIGAAFGISLQAMVKTSVEFTRRMGEARIKGGELTNILAKMGIGLDEVANGTFNHQKAMQALAESYAAGTDEATLLYYGTKMFGDSFKELLPMIKAGSKAISEASGSYYNAGEDEISAAGRLADIIENVGRSIKNILIDIIGGFHAIMEDLAEFLDNISEPGFWNPFESSKDKLARQIRNAPKGMTNEEIKNRVLNYYPKSERDKVSKEIDEKNKGKGKVLSPFGLTEAGGASQLQQMAGGDIIGTMAFSPLTQIEKNTKETADNTKPIGQVPPQPTRPPDVLTK